MRSVQRDSLSPKRTEELRAWADSVKKMLTGSGEDVDELLAKFPFRSQKAGAVRLPEDRFPELHNPTMVDAIRKMLRHTARTGHKFTDLLFRK
jgi:endonuclease III